MERMMKYRPRLATAMPATTFTAASFSLASLIHVFDPAMMYTWPLARPYPLGVFTFLLHSSWRHLIGNFMILFPVATAYDVAVAGGAGGEHDPFLGLEGFTAYTLMAQAVGEAADLAFNPLYRVPGAMLVGSSTLIFSTLALSTAALWAQGRRAAALASLAGGLALAVLMDTVFPTHVIALLSSLTAALAWLAVREAYRRGLLARLLAPPPGRTAPAPARRSPAPVGV